MSVNWGLGLSQDVGGNVFNSFLKGQEMGRIDQGNKAMTAYVTDPNDKSLNALAPFQPEFVLGQKQAQQKAKAEADEKQLIGRALNGDPAARQQLAYVNSDMYIKLDERGKKAVDEAMKPIGELAFNILQLPEDQQGPALDQALAGLEARGWDTSKFQRSGNAKQDLLTALAITGKLSDWEKFAQPRYTPIGEAGLAGFQFGKPIQQGGQPQNFAPQPQQPAGGEAVITAEQFTGAVNGLGAQGAAEWAKRNGIKVRVNTPGEANSLPPGTHYITPDGQEIIR